MLQFFTFEYLPVQLRQVSAPFALPRDLLDLTDALNLPPAALVTG
jgi:hypothetical protein